MRLIWPGCLAVLVCAGFPCTAAFASANDTQAVLSECNISGLPAAAIESCLRRVRVLEETAPSPKLESLEARLEELQSGNGIASPNGPPKPLQPLEEETVAAEPVIAASSEPITPPATRTAAAAPLRQNDADALAGDEYGSNDAVDPSLGDDEPPIADPPDDAATNDDDPR